MSLIIALIVSILCPSETSWIEYDGNAYIGVCGDADGRPL